MDLQKLAELAEAIREEQAANPEREAVLAAMRSVTSWDLSTERTMKAIAEAIVPIIREYQAKALRDAATELARLQYVSPHGKPDARAHYEKMLAIRRGNTDAWLNDRAKQYAP